MTVRFCIHNSINFGSPTPLAEMEALTITENDLKKKGACSVFTYISLDVTESIS